MKLRWTSSARSSTKNPSRFAIERSQKDFVPSYSIATVYLGLGMKEEALQHIVKSFHEGSCYMIYLKVDPLLDSVRSDPLFVDVMRRVGHPL